MAPEVLRKERQNKEVDWWCFGNIIYEMITGLPPFFVEGSAKEAMFKKILE